MESQTLRTRLAQLIQKSRKALRLYSSVGKSAERGSEFSELQIREWKHANAELLRELSSALEQPHSRQLVADVFALRDRFLGDARAAETDLHLKQKDLIGAAESADFIKAAVLSGDLVVLKARLQACQAAYHELADVIARSRLTPPTIELSGDRMLAEEAERARRTTSDDTTEPRLAKVIQLRQSGTR